jgi:hypothetical protein
MTNVNSRNNIYKCECQNKYCIETMDACDTHSGAEIIGEAHMMKYGHIVEIYVYIKTDLIYDEE